MKRKLIPTRKELLQRIEEFEAKESQKKRIEAEMRRQKEILRWIRESKTDLEHFSDTLDKVGSKCRNLNEKMKEARGTLKRLQGLGIQGIDAMFLGMDIAELLVEIKKFMALLEIPLPGKGNKKKQSLIKEGDLNEK